MDVTRATVTCDTARARVVDVRVRHELLGFLRRYEHESLRLRELRSRLPLRELVRVGRRIAGQRVGAVGRGVVLVVVVLVLAHRGMFPWRYVAYVLHNGERMESTLASLAVKNEQADSGTAHVETVEDWSVVYRDSGSGRTIRVEKYRIHARYTLLLQDGSWLVNDVEELERTAQ